MKTKTLLITLALSIGIFTACTDKKKDEKKKTPTEETTDKAEKRRLDSIQQVKEHGHAH